MADDCLRIALACIDDMGIEEAKLLTCKAADLEVTEVLAIILLACDEGPVLACEPTDSADDR